MADFQCFYGLYICHKIVMNLSAPKKKILRDKDLLVRKYMPDMNQVIMR